MHSITKQLLKMPGVKLREFQELLGKGSHDVLDYCKVVTVEAETRFIAVDEDISTVWILLSGQVKALEEYATGDIFIFKKFPAPEVFGEVETLADITRFRATLITETECVFLNLPVGVYQEFMKNNPQYLYRRTKVILKRSLDEKKHMRMFLMMESIDRIKIYLIQNYKLFAKDDMCILRITRQQMAEETGYAVKTVNRAIKLLSEENLLEVRGQRIIIKETQYKEMFESVGKYLNY